MSPAKPFHLAFPVHDLDVTRTFYIEVLGCTEGRSSDTWVDFNFFGHQISAHLRPGKYAPAVINPVDGKDVPIPHFGLILGWGEWQGLAERLKDKNVDFLHKPFVRFRGQPGEQGSLFIRDPSGNALEFKAFKEKTNVFATA